MIYASRISTRCLRGFVMAAGAAISSTGLAMLSAVPLADLDAPTQSEAMTPFSTRDVASLVMQLDDDSIAVRAEAERQLGEAGLTQDQLEQAIQDPKTTPEQRARLDHLGPRVLYQTPRAAIGVSFTRGIQRDVELQVSAIYPKFDSQRVLEVGDIITAINGRAMETLNDELRPSVIMHPPGTEITAKVLRRGRTITVKFKLGSFRDLGADRRGWGSDLSYEECRRAWVLRSEELSKARTSTALDTGFDAATWTALAETDKRTRPSAASWGDPTVIAAGQPRENAAASGTGSLTLSGMTRGNRIEQGVANGRRMREIEEQLLDVRLPPEIRRLLIDELVDLRRIRGERIDVLPGRIP